METEPGNEVGGPPFGVAILGRPFSSNLYSRAGRFLAGPSGP